MLPNVFDKVSFFLMLFGKYCEKNAFILFSFFPPKLDR